MNPQIKKLYDEANSLYAQAKALMAKGELSAEDQAQVDRLLDQVEAKTAEAKRLERMDSARQTFEEPANERPFFQPTEPAGQPGPSGQGNAPELKAVFRKMALHGARALTPEEHKVLYIGDPTAGGYLVQPSYQREVIAAQRSMMAMRQICDVQTVGPGGVVIPTDSGADADATWTTELATGNEDTVKPFGDRALVPHPIAKLVKVSRTFLRSPTFDAEGYVRDRGAYRLSRPQENAFINGSGSQQPLGILTPSTIPTFTTAAANTVAGDDVINWRYSLPSSYDNPRTRMLFNRAFIRKVRTLKTGGGDYLWQPGLSLGLPNRILDIPYAVSDLFNDGLDAADAWEDDAKIAVVGDFWYYKIVDSEAMEVQRLDELYAASNEVGFVFRAECDGMPVLAEAFYILKVKA